ncbi:MAG: hypothetical protein JWO76_512 [Nocardioides sp.]|nr:hypothetical protein [Nocardioides sp.]
MRDRLLAGVIVVPFALGLSAGAAPDRGEVAFTFQDPAIVESSGLAVQGGLVLTTNDSGDAGRVFAVDPATGRTVGVTRWSDEPTDVEALAPAGGGEVWVGDIGDNTGSRDSVQVARVPVGRGDRSVDVATYDLTYPHGPADAESLLADPATGRLYVATKSVFGGRLYEAPATLSADAPNRLRPVGDVLPIATDATFLPDGEHLVVRDYSQAAVYGFPSMERLATFRLPRQDQGEGIAVAADGTLLVSSEGQGSDVLRVALPDAVRRALEPTSSPSPSVAPSGGSRSRSGEELPETTDTERPAWPWLLTGAAGLVAVGVLLRSLRTR